MIRRSEILAGQCFGNCEDGALIAYNTMGDDVLIQAHKLDSDNETQPVVLLNAKFIYDQAFTDNVRNQISEVFMPDLLRCAQDLELDTRDLSVMILDAGIEFGHFDPDESQIVVRLSNISGHKGHCILMNVYNDLEERIFARRRVACGEPLAVESVNL